MKLFPAPILKQQDFYLRVVSDRQLDFLTQPRISLHFKALTQTSFDVLSCLQL